MKFSCAKEKLEYALIAVERFTGKNTTLPILGNVLLEDKKNSLYVSATNLECAIQIHIPGNGNGEGKLSVPAKIISSFVQSFKDERIELEANQENLLIKANNKNTRINGMSAEEFPLVPKVNPVSCFWVDGIFLTKGLAKVLPAVSISEFKPELNGVFFKFISNQLHLVATDTFRLAEQVLPLKKKDGESASFIVPYRISSELARVFGDEEVKISLGENQVLFESGGIAITARLVEGNFPDYQQIIPRNFNTSVYVNGKDFIEAVRASSLFVSKLQDVALSFHDSVLDINSRNQEIGEYATSVPVTLQGKSVSLSVNYRYLLDGINNISGKDLFWGCNNEDSPIMLCDKEDNSFLYILMPIRLN